MKKYEFTGEKLGSLRQIRALKDFGAIKVGTIGGGIESEKNLSHEGNAWVSDNAKVSGDAQVWGNAWVSGNAKIYGNARVSGDAVVSGKAQVWDNARVLGNAQVWGNAWVSDNAKVSGNAQVWGDAWVSDNAKVSGNAQVWGDAVVSGKAQVSDNAKVSGNAQVWGDARVSSKTFFLLVGPIGSRRSFLTVTPDAKIKVRYTTGCFSGDLKTFKAAILKSHGKTSLYAKQYAAAIAMAKTCIKPTKETTT